MLSEKSQQTQNGTMFVDLNWPLKHLAGCQHQLSFLSNQVADMLQFYGLSVARVCRSPIRLELFTCWHPTVRERSLIQAPLENPPVQTDLVLLRCCKRLCILGPHGAIEMCVIIIFFYFFYTLGSKDPEG